MSKLTRIHQSFHGAYYPRYCPPPERPQGEPIPGSAYSFDNLPLLEEEPPPETQALLNPSEFAIAELNNYQLELRTRDRLKNNFKRFVAYIFKKEPHKILSKRVLCEEGLPSFSASKPKLPKPKIFRRYVDPVFYQLPKYKQLKQQMDTQLPYEYPDVFGEHSDASSIVFGESGLEGFSTEVNGDQEIEDGLDGHGEEWDEETENGEQIEGPNNEEDRLKKSQFSEEAPGGEGMLESVRDNGSFVLEEEDEDTRDQGDIKPDHEKHGASGLVFTEKFNDCHYGYRIPLSCPNLLALPNSQLILESSFLSSSSSQKQHHSMPANVSNFLESCFSRNTSPLSLPSPFKTPSDATLGRRIQFTLEKLQECAKVEMGSSQRKAIKRVGEEEFELTIEPIG